MHLFFVLLVSFLLLAVLDMLLIQQLAKNLLRKTIPAWQTAAAVGSENLFHPLYSLADYCLRIFPDGIRLSFYSAARLTWRSYGDPTAFGNNCFSDSLQSLLSKCWHPRYDVMWKNIFNSWMLVGFSQNTWCWKILNWLSLDDLCVLTAASTPLFDPISLFCIPSRTKGILQLIFLPLTAIFMRTPLTARRLSVSTD